ncbi:AAA family ATPase [Hydrotalea sp. AMD]|uniref:AAA family ATPase n=3 Tax=Hydrotalea TaxID=1004300 RepID=UPI0015CF092B|nr:AAA family ATPase [Hydrotalea sp. AMD]
MKQFPAVAIIGARQIGKSTIARQIADKKKSTTVYFDLEKPSDRRKLEDAETMLAGLKDKLVIIDEVQTMPELFAILRPLIDEYRKPGRFMLLGSVSPFLVRGISESLAGRIAHIELPTINLMEANKAKIAQDKI